MLRTTRLTAAILLTLGLAACASATTRSAPGQARDSVDLVVDTRNSSNRSITVYLVHARSGQRNRLGTVRMGERKSFGYSTFMTGARYRFVARETGGSEWASGVFTVTPGDVAEWRTHRDVVWVGARATQY